MKRMVQQSLPPMEVKNIHHDSCASAVADMDMEEARHQLGTMIARAIAWSRHKRSVFGSLSLIDKVCHGGVTQVLANVWRHPTSRRAFVEAVVRAHQGLVLQEDRGAEVVTMFVFTERKAS